MEIDIIAFDKAILQLQILKLPCIQLIEMQIILIYRHANSPVIIPVGVKGCSISLEGSPVISLTHSKVLYFPLQSDFFFFAPVFLENYFFFFFFGIFFCLAWICNCISGLFYFSFSSVEFFSPLFQEYFLLCPSAFLFYFFFSYPASGILIFLSNLCPKSSI